MLYAGLGYHLRTSRCASSTRTGRSSSNERSAGEWTTWPSGKVGSYFGLVPCEDSSAARERLGHITKQGPPAMRQLLVEAAWIGIRRSPTLRRRFEQTCHDDRDRRKVAIVGLARHLSQVMAAMLRDDRPWREEGAVAAAAAA